VTPLIAAALLSLVPASVPDPPTAAPAGQGAKAPPPSSELRLPRTGLEPGSLVAPAVALAALAAAALVLRRRRRAPARRVEVLETTSLGPKRSLVLARLGDEILLLGASEAGIHLLRKRPAPLGDEALEEARPGEPDRPPLLPAPLTGLVERLRRARPGPPGIPFDALLGESAEDLELRSKLARGQRGSVR